MPRRGRGWAIQGEGRFEVRHYAFDCLNACQFY